jgi:hypothetical protein
MLDQRIVPAPAAEPKENATRHIREIRMSEEA